LEAFGMSSSQISQPAAIDTRSPLYCSPEEREKQQRHVRWLRIRQLLIDAANRVPMSQRPWFRIAEIADHCARIPGSVDLVQAKRERAIELLRKSILTGEFDDAKSRSTVANLHESIAAELRFHRYGADTLEYFVPLAEHLWIRRAACEAWFKRNQIELPTSWFPPINATKDQRTPAAGISAKLPSATKRFNKESAKEFIEGYCKETEKAGGKPTQEAARKKALEAGYVGSRPFIDAGFKALKGPLKVGRPQRVTRRKRTV
jgi:hypothetical protein